MADLQIPGLELEYAFSVTIYVAERIDFKGPRGGKGYVPPARGEVYGPLLNGRVVPYSGADYAIFDDIATTGIKVNTHYMLESDDGHWIYINNRGYLHRTPDHNTGEVKLYFRMTPLFEAPFGPYEWMSRTMFVGTGERLTDPDRSQFTYYRVL